jgi:hypothetical protein
LKKAIKDIFVTSTIKGLVGGKLNITKSFLYRANHLF